MSAVFLPPRVPLVDPRTGMITREWYILLQNFFQLDSGISNDLIATIAPAANADAALVMVDQLGDDMQVAPPPQPLFFAADDVLPIINGLRDEIAMLRARIDDMAKGGVIL